MWQVVYIAEDHTLVERINQKLSQEGMLVRLRRFSSKSKGTQPSTEIMVPKSEAGEAMEIIQSLFVQGQDT